MLPLFLKGLIIGFSIAAPVGPIGILCINRSLHDGWKTGLSVGLGAATADGFYGAVAGFGLAFITNFLLMNAGWIKLIGGVFLIYLGIQIMRSKPPRQDLMGSRKFNLLRSYTTTFFLTLSNPMTILSFIAIFAGLGISETSYAGASILVIGVIIGSTLWWLLLSSSIALFLRKKINPAKLYWVNLASGLIILIFGLIVLVMYLH